MPKSARQLAAMREAGRQIVQAPGQIRQTHQNRWVVSSQTCGTPSYVAVLGIKGLVCDCAQGELGRGLCKHVAAVDMWLSGKWAAMHGPERAAIRRPAIRCPANASHRLVRDGHRTTKRKGKVQKYLCRDCGKRCPGLPGLRRWHASATTISDALSLVSKGMSLARVAEDIARRGPEFHRSTIYRWTAAYGPLMEGYAGKIRPWTGYRWHCDEVYFKILGNGAYLFTVMDYSTRFVLSYMVSPVKIGAEPLEMFREAARRAGTAPWVFVTDGLDVFPGAARKAFWRRAGRRLVHAVEVHMRNEFNHNNVHERLNGELKPLIRKRGGYKVANPVMVGLVVLGYDFFRPHAALNGRTPAEAAGIRMEGNDRVQALLEAAAA